MIQTISIEDYLNQQDALILVDVRSPGEFVRGHIPGANNVPLFSNEERKNVGTCYKQEGREKAILLALDLTAPKWSGFIKKCLEISPSRQIVLHCWRGGMRSGAMAWVLDLYGFDVLLIKGGYKQYRRWAHLQFEKNYRLCVLGGMTGSGKTNLLHQLNATGIQVLDLEYLARHQGSSYGSMNKMVQPSQEQFENDFAKELSKNVPGKWIWLEDECQKIGRVGIPNTFWNLMRLAPVIALNVNVEQRISALVVEYGNLDQDFLIECTERIRKRLGPEQTKNAVAAIRENRMADFIRIVLVYYDKTYRRGLEKRPPGQVFSFDIGDTKTDHITRDLIAFSSKILSETKTVAS